MFTTRFPMSLRWSS